MVANSSIVSTPSGVHEEATEKETELDAQETTPRTENLEKSPATLELIVSSYAAILDPNEGTSLNYVLAEMINGAKYAKMSRANVNPEIEYWQNAIICSVLGANPPLKAHDIEKIILVKKGIFLPLLCSHCQMYGHDIANCKKKGLVRQEWRVIHREPVSEEQTVRSAQTSDQQAEDLPKDDFSPVKEKNVHTIASRTFPGWKWIHNFSLNPKGRIWIAWKLKVNEIKLLSMSDQMIHCHATQVQDNKKFFITFV
ncbi:hypothetical protein Cgig2_003907 [Carnegiea gigantea]|uniref:Uncharacterized protein n=1 Tax=Carnegiea gigantea TaxID=171969 RepID=A0A9Q1GQW4_9CARY|nr:hypothetical protein Cgig2_003907 [Carnegiea gigantea]